MRAPVAPVVMTVTVAALADDSTNDVAPRACAVKSASNTVVPPANVPSMILHAKHWPFTRADKPISDEGISSGAPLVNGVLAVPGTTIPSCVHGPAIVAAV